MAKKKIAVDDGHGLKTAGKRSPKFLKDIFDKSGNLLVKKGTFIKENEFNAATADKFIVALKRCGFETILVAPGSRDLSLKSRVRNANVWGADGFQSIHFNAYDGKWKSKAEGVSVHYFRYSKQSKLLAQTLIGFLIKGTKQKNRGIKATGLYVNKYTNMPAALAECGFMDNEREAARMRDKDFQTEVAEELCQGWCAYFKVKYISPDIKEEDIEYAIEFEKLQSEIKEMYLLLQTTEGKLKKAEKTNWANDIMIDQVDSLNQKHADRLRQIHQISDIN